MLNLLASLTTPKKEASPTTTTVKIQVTPGMADEEILQQVRSMAIMNAVEDEPPSTPSEGGGGRSDTRAFYQSPDHVLNAIAEESERTYADRLSQLSRSSSNLNRTLTHGSNMEMAKRRFHELQDLDDKTVIESIYACRDYAEQTEEDNQVSLVDILFPPGTPVVTEVDWTIQRAKSTCFVSDVNSGHKSTVLSLAVIRVGVMNSPEVIRKRNLQLVEVLIFLLWKAGCPSATDKSRIEPYWRRRITEVIEKVKRIPEPTQGASIMKKVIATMARLDALLAMSDISDHEVRRKHFMLTAVGRTPDEFNNTFITQHRATWIQDGYTWREFVELIIDFAENYDRASSSKALSSRVHVARTSVAVSNNEGSSDNQGQADIIANLVEQVANLTNEITAMKKGNQWKKDKVMLIQGRRTKSKWA